MEMVFQFGAQIALHHRPRPGVERRHVDKWIGALELAVAGAPGSFEEGPHHQLDNCWSTRWQWW